LNTILALTSDHRMSEHKSVPQPLTSPPEQSVIS